MKEDDLYETRILTNKITIHPRDMNTLDLNDIVQKKLIEKVSGYCISDGIIRPESITILSRSMGELYNHDTSGSVHYIVKYEADVCNPREGQVIRCIVDEHTDTQTICYIDDEKTSPLEIYLSKQNYLNNTSYASLKKDDVIMVRVIACNIELGRDKIDTIAEFLQKN